MAAPAPEHQPAGYQPRHRTHGAFRRVSGRDPCPICGKPDWCRVFEDGGVQCMRVESVTPCRSGGWMHWPDGPVWAAQRERAAFAPSQPSRKADPERLHVLYSRHSSLVRPRRRRSLRGLRAVRPGRRRPPVPAPRPRLLGRSDRGPTIRVARARPTASHRRPGRGRTRRSHGHPARLLPVREGQRRRRPPGFRRRERPPGPDPRRPQSHRRRRHPPGRPREGREAIRLVEHPARTLSRRVRVGIAGPRRVSAARDRRRWRRGRGLDHRRAAEGRPRGGPPRPDRPGAAGRRQWGRRSCPRSGRSGRAAWCSPSIRTRYLASGSG